MDDGQGSFGCGRPKREIRKILLLVVHTCGRGRVPTGFGQAMLVLRVDRSVPQSNTVTCVLAVLAVSSGPLSSAARAIPNVSRTP